MPNFFYLKLPRVNHKIEIKIKGNSTVGKYTCATILYKKDTLNVEALEKNTIKATTPMTSIDCGNKSMTKYLQATVKATQFPSSTVTLSDVKPLGNHYKCNLTFLITNKIIRYKDFTLTKNNNKLHGKIALKFSDIGLAPPVKMGGLIKVKDDIEIQFSLHQN